MPDITLKLSNQDARAFKMFLGDRYSHKMKLETLLYKAIREIVAEQAELTLAEIEKQEFKDVDV